MSDVVISVEQHHNTGIDLGNGGLVARALDAHCHFRIGYIASDGISVIVVENFLARPAEIDGIAKRAVLAHASAVAPAVAGDRR